MDPFLLFVIGLIVLALVLALVWKAGVAAIGLAPNDPTLRTVLYILALLLLAFAIWHYAGHLVRMP